MKEEVGGKRGSRTNMNDSDQLREKGGRIRE